MLDVQCLTSVLTALVSFEFYTIGIHVIMVLDKVGITIVITYRLQYLHFVKVRIFSAIISCVMSMLPNVTSGVIPMADCT